MRPLKTRFKLKALKPDFLKGFLLGRFWGVWKLVINHQRKSNDG